MNTLVRFALRQRMLIMVVLGVLLLAGGIAFSQLNIEAYPDPVPPMVEVVTQSNGLSAEEMERNVTIPVEVQMSGLNGLKAIRAISLFGLSDVKIQFSYDQTFDQAQQSVINRLSQLPPLPGGIQASISPTSPVGEVYRYRLKAPAGYSVMDLKTIQDWVLQRRIKAIPGVIDVTGWGGKLRTYEVVVDRDQLVANNVTVGQVISAIGKSDSNVGGQTINFGPQAAIVRGIGLIQSADQIEHVLVATNGNVPVELKNVATVKIGNQPRLGIAGQDGDNDIVMGIVLMQRGAKSMPTIQAVKAAVADINASGVLPPGVSLERIYDRSDLINVTTGTVIHNLIMGVLLIFILQWLFLGNLRCALIVAMTIPFALAFAVLILTIQGESANLLSVGALDFGLIVDASVIMVENVFRHMVERARHVDQGHSHFSYSSRMSAVLHGSTEVSRGIFFAATIIIASFIPLFALTGVEGHIFGPMAKTYAYAIVGGLIATFTIAPVLSAFLLKDVEEEKETPIVRAMRRVYDPTLRFALGNRIVALGTMGGLLLAASIAMGGLGLEFLPKLEEGNFWIRATLPPSVSLEEAQGYVNRMRHILMKYPEVKTVISQLGRPDDGTDTTGFFNAEFYVPLKPAGEWPAGVTKEALTKQVNEELAAPFPGVEFNFSQNIEDNVEEAASGVKGANSIKLYGNDLEAMENTAYKIKAIMAGVPGITDLSVFDAIGQPTVNIKINRDKAAHYGLAPGDINAVVQAAIGGQSAGNLYEYGSDRNFPIVIRLAPAFRQSLDAIRAIPVALPNATGGVSQIPLSTVADVRLVSGYSFIYRENQSRYIPIKFSVRGRDLGGAVLEAQHKIDAQVALPPGSRIEWVGEFGDLQAALSRLEVVVPISLALIMILLFLNFGSITDMCLAASVMPMALVGGVLILAFTGTPFSVSAAIGFIGLFGISVMEGILVLAYFNQLLSTGMARGEAVLHAARTRFRPVMMTCIAACVGLLPAAVSTGIGSQVQRPLALVVVGGILLAPVLILIVLPVMIDLFSKRRNSDPEPAE